MYSIYLNLDSKDYQKSTLWVGSSTSNNISKAIDRISPELHTLQAQQAQQAKSCNSLLNIENDT